MAYPPDLPVVQGMHAFLRSDVDHSQADDIQIMSPKIILNVNGAAYDEDNRKLYVDISQIFSIWFIPFHQSKVNLTTVLELTQTSGSRKYYIKSQNDLYQVDQFFQFFAPWGIGTVIVALWHFGATFCCVILAQFGKPYTRWQQKQQQQVRTNGVSHDDDAGDTSVRKTIPPSEG